MKGRVFINLYNFVNSLDLILEKNVKSYNNSFVNDFIDQLKNHLAINNSIEKFKKIPENTFFTLDRYESDFAVCENRTTCEMFVVPKSLVPSTAKEGEILIFKNNLLHVDSEKTQQEKSLIQDLVEKNTKFK